VVLVRLKLTPVASWLPSVFDAAGWVIWLVKIVPEMTYKVSSGTLNLCSLTHALKNSIPAQPASRDITAADDGFFCTCKLA